MVNNLGMDFKYVFEITRLVPSTVHGTANNKKLGGGLGRSACVSLEF